MVNMKPISSKITHKRVAVNSLRRAFSLPKLSSPSYFTLQLPDFYAKIRRTLWGLKEEGNSCEPTVRRNVSGLDSALKEGKNLFGVEFFKPGRRVSITEAGVTTN